jgi:hypothetical protein
MHVADKGLCNTASRPTLHTHTQNTTGANIMQAPIKFSAWEKSACCTTVGAATPVHLSESAHTTYRYQCVTHFRKLYEMHSAAWLQGCGDNFLQQRRDVSATCKCSETRARTLLVLNLRLYVVDSVIRFDLEGNCLASERFYKDLHGSGTMKPTK